MHFSHILKKLLLRIYNDSRQEHALPRRTVLTIERLEDRLSPAVFPRNRLSAKGTERILKQEMVDAFFSLYPTMANSNEDGKESVLADEAAIRSLQEDEPAN